jgi:hypothetical protein
MTRILHILPRVPPAVCGIGDYAWGIARKLRDEHGIHSSFLAAGTTWTQPVGETEFPVFRLPELSALALVEDVAARKEELGAVVLHLSPYGFQKRGVPLWLASGWQQIARMPGRPRLITMFHELYASGPMRSSAFWLQPLQKWVLRTVACASDGLRTNRQGYADWLERKLGLKNGVVTVMPVFSNLGEPTVLPSWNEREPAMALFCWGIHSGESLETVVRKAASCCRRFSLARLHLIGCKQAVDETGLGIEVVRHGFMEAPGLSALLSSCRMAYTAYSPEHFGKSTLMAAFAAHGLAVITQGRTNVLPDGLLDGVNVLNESSLDEQVMQAKDSVAGIGNSLRHWYDQHSLDQNAQSYASQIKRLVDSSVSPCP